MLNLAVTFFVIALIAAIFGFGGIAAASVELAKIVFFIFLALFAITTVIHVLQGRNPPAV